jgi:hypothetical protein
MHAKYWFILSILFFFDVAVLGCLILLAAGRIYVGG